MKPIIEVAELHDALDTVALYDIRWALTDPSHGRQTYLDGHIPGAVFVDLDHDLASEPDIRGRHPLPQIDSFASTLGRLGITPYADVVVYDDAGGAIAARMWWMLGAIGHGSVRLLNGGYEAWLEAGLEVETGSNTPTPTEYVPRHGYTGLVTHEELAGRVVVDVRSAERYRGDTEPVDPKPGHIPGAINRPLTDTLAADKRFRGLTELAEMYADLASKPVVSCGSGVNACHSALAMTLAGFELPDVYIGSYSEWSRRDFPVVVGESP